MPSNESYRSFLEIFYPVFFTSSIINQSIVIYVIFKHTPRYLQTMKFVLSSTCACQVVHVSACFVMQLRQVSSLKPVEIWSYGPGRYLEAYIGYSLYHVIQTATMLSGILVVTSLYLKYEAASMTKFKQNRRVWLFIALYTPVILSTALEILLILTTSLPEDVQEIYRVINANVTDHSVVGTSDFNNLASLINLAIISTSVFYLPIVGLVSRRKILKHLKITPDRSSAAKNIQNRIFVTGLTIQTILPLCFYCPISLIYFYNLIMHDEILFQQYFMFLIPAFPAFVDPCLTLYFVTPYRNVLKTWFRRVKGSRTVTVVTSQMKHL